MKGGMSSYNINHQKLDIFMFDTQTSLQGMERDILPKVIQKIYLKHVSQDGAP